MAFALPVYINITLLLLLLLLFIIVIIAIIIIIIIIFMAKRPTHGNQSNTDLKKISSNLSRKQSSCRNHMPRFCVLEVLSRSFNFLIIATPLPICVMNRNLHDKIATANSFRNSNIEIQYTVHRSTSGRNRCQMLRTLFAATLPEHLLVAFCLRPHNEHAPRYW